MKSRVISTISAAFFISAIGYFGFGIYQENKTGEKNTKAKFDTLLQATKASAETDKIVSQEFKSNFFNAIGDFGDFSEISLSVDGTCIYSYPSVEDKLSGTTAASKKFISKKRETTTAKNVVYTPADNQDMNYDLTLETGIYKIKQNTIYNNAKIAFVLALIGTIASVIALLVKDKTSKAEVENEAKRKQEELLNQIREERRKLLETQREMAETASMDDEEFYGEDFDDEETIEEDSSSDENQESGEQSFEDTIVFSDEEGAAEAEADGQYAKEQAETENGSAAEETEEEAPHAETAAENESVAETEEDAEPVAENEEKAEAEEADEPVDEAEEKTEEAAEPATEAEPGIESDEEQKTQSEVEVQDTAEEQKQDEQEATESAFSEDEAASDSGSAEDSENGFQEPVLEDTSTKDGDLGTIGTDIASPKTFIQDLGEQLKKNTYTEISLALIKITDFDWDAYETEEKAKEIIALAKENFEETSEIYKADIPNTLGIVLNGTDLTETIAECEKILPAIQEVLGSLDGEHKVHIGISAMNYRAIPPDRIMVEAKGALEEAESDPDNPIVAFKANPDLYKKEIGNELEQE